MTPPATIASDLAEARGNREGQRRRQHRQGGARPVRRHAPRHAPDRLRHHGDGDDLQAVQPGAELATSPSRATP